VWREGDSQPYSDPTDSGATREVNDIIDSSLNTYDLFLNLSGGTYRSFDGDDGTMHAIQDFSAPDWCPNASWNGSLTSFCEGMAADDVIAHEWTHAYTDGTHDLIYQWQPGALNESFSDIFGEVADLLNGSGSDIPGGPRSDGQCSSFAGGNPPVLQITAPEPIAGTYQAGGAVFNPGPPWSAEGRVEQAAAGIGAPSEGCGPFVDFTSGRIALVDRGNCNFREKSEHARDAGAVGVIVANTQGDQVLEMGGAGSRLSIPSVLVGQSDGGAIRERLASGVTAAMSQDGGGDASFRWLVGEDTVFTVIRDMWNPLCAGDPGKVSDPSYVCDLEPDQGGVHSNSGVSNHAFALLVDGGEYNGHTVEPIGLTRAAHVYWRAMSAYQVPTTDFTEHADLLELSCSDLVGAGLPDLLGGGISHEVITTTDCARVAVAMSAVEMRREPSQCVFTPLLQAAPPVAPRGVEVFFESFDSDPGDEWTLLYLPVFPGFEPRNWVWTADLPGGRRGGAYFAIDPGYGGCGGSNDQSGVLFATSPTITLAEARGVPVVHFDHYVATEAGYDGGNVKLSVNGGAFRPIPSTAFTLSPYNDSLTNVAGGNTNPLAGEPAFTGTDGGTVAGSWGQSRIDLSGLVEGGDSIRLRFEFGVDGCTGVDGWYIDDIRVVTVSPPRSGVRRVP